MKVLVILSLFALISRQASALACLKKQLIPRNNEGYLESPGYPNEFSVPTCIMWFCHVFRETKVTIRIQDLNIPSLNQCSSNISNRLIIGPQHHLFCNSGEEGTRYEAVTSTFFYILFIANEKLAPRGRGFQLYYKLEPIAYPGKSLPRNVTVLPFTTTTTTTTTTSATTTAAAMTEKSASMSSFSCAMSTSDRTGVITVSRHILVRSRNSHACTWLLYFPDYSTPGIHNALPTFSLTFQRFDLPLECCSSLEIYAGADESSRLVGHYRGWSHPHYLTVYGQRAFLKFTYSPGFVGNFTVRFERREICFKGYSPCSFNESGCYPTRKRCDGVWDCPNNGGDERGCPGFCEKNKFPCHNSSNYCYSLADRCNGKGACSNYRDEENCSPEQCSASKGLFLCADKRCIYEKWRCDHTKDCIDGSDEADCNKFASPRLMMACVVGVLISSLLLVLALSFAFRIYVMRTRVHRDDFSSRHDSPLSRIEQDLLRRRVPPPQYNEAMLTSRSFDEAYLELLNQSRANLSTEDGVSTSETVGHDSTTPSANGGNGGRRSRNDRRRRRQRSSNGHPVLQRSLPSHCFTDQPPGYSDVSQVPTSTQSDQSLGATGHVGHEMQTLQTTSSLEDPAPPPYSLHDVNNSDSASCSGDDEGDFFDGDEEDDFPDQGEEGEDCRLLGGSDDEGEEEGDTCLSIRASSDLDRLCPLSLSTARHPNPALSSSDQELVCLDVDKAETPDDKDEEDGKKANEESSSLSCESLNVCGGESVDKDNSPSSSKDLKTIEEEEEDCECILNMDADQTCDSGDSEDTTCLLAN